MPEDVVVHEFLVRVQRGDLKGVNVTYQASGGMPGEQHIREQVTIMDSARAHVHLEATGTPPSEASADVNAQEVEVLFQKLAQGVGELVPRDQAKFLPDSLVGSVTIEIGGQSTTLFFLADAEERRDQNKPLSPDTLEALEGFSRFSRHLVQREPK